MDPHRSPFESNLIRLLSLERGRPSHTSSQKPVELSFTLTEEEAAEVARWNNRQKTARYVIQHGILTMAYRVSFTWVISDLSTSMCVSLVSYPLDQRAQAFECEPDAEQGELDVVGFGLPRPWPQDGSVYVVLDVSGDHGQPRSINVAPPFGFVSRYCLPSPSARRHHHRVRTPFTSPWISGSAEYTLARIPSISFSSATTRIVFSPLYCIIPLQRRWPRSGLPAIVNGRWRSG